MKKIMLSVAVLLMSSVASADMLLNGIGFDADELCFTGSYVEAQSTKSRNLYRENGQGDLIVIGTKTVTAGDRFAWRRATSVRDNGQGDLIPVHFNRNGRPVVIDRITRGSDENEEVTIIKTVIPNC